MAKRNSLRSPVVALVMAATIAVAAATLFAPTGASAGTPEVSKATVQTQAEMILAAKTGQKLPTVTCPSGVAAKVGAVIRCTVVPHGMTLKYPATVTVRSIRGNRANFYVQVGQALGQGDQATFCSDYAVLSGALSTAKSPVAFLAAIVANKQTLLQLQASAPTKIVNSAGTLVEAARQAVDSGSITIFRTKSVAKAVVSIDAFCKKGTGK
jgi:hypothetical protein